MTRIVPVATGLTSSAAISPVKFFARAGNSTTTSSTGPSSSNGVFVMSVSWFASQAPTPWATALRLACSWSACASSTCHPRRGRRARGVADYGRRQMRPARS
jgi:hypothetical protein